MNTENINRPMRRNFAHLCTWLGCLALAALVTGCGNTTPGNQNTNTSNANSAPQTTGLSDRPETPRQVESVTKGRSNAQDNPEGWPAIEFEPAQLDFGVLPPGDYVTTDIKIHNVGNQPLRIVGSATTCGCTTAENINGRTIPPGDFIEFQVEMKPKSGLGEKREGVRMKFQGYEPLVEYIFEAEVSRAIRAEPPHLWAVDMQTQQPILNGTFEIVAQDGKPFRVLRANGKAPMYVNYNPETDPPQTSYELKWDITQEHQRNTVPWFWVVETDHATCPIVDLRIRHNSTRPTRPPGRPWQPKDQRRLLDRVHDGETVQIKYTIEYPRGATPNPDSVGVSTRNNRLDAALDHVVEDGQLLICYINVTPHQSQPGLFYEVMDVHADGYTSPLRIIGTIVK